MEDKREQLQIEENVNLKQNLSLLNGCGIIIGSIIGSGIFISPVGVLTSSGSVGMSLLVWIFCGVYSAIGALCYAEIGITIPRSGGDYSYIFRAFGRMMAFLLAWNQLVLVRPVTHAAVAFIFSSNLLVALKYIFCLEIDVQKSPATLLMSAACILIVTIINCRSVRAASMVQDLFMGAKLLALMIIILTGLVIFVFGNTSSSFQNPFHDTKPPTSIALSFYQGLFAYGGWNFLNFVTQEVKNPKKNLPLAIVISVPVVTVVYLCTNLAYFVGLSTLEMKNSSAVAIDFARKHLSFFYMIMPIFIAMSCVGTLNGSLMTGARIFFVAAEDKQLPSAFQLIHLKYMTPFLSLLICGLSSCIFLLFDIFTLINFFSTSNWIFIGIVVAGQIYLRYTEPNLERPLKLPIIFPILYVISTVCLIVMAFKQAVLDTIIGIVITLAGLPLWFLFVFWESRPKIFSKISNKLTYLMQATFVCGFQSNSA